QQESLESIGNLIGKITSHRDLPPKQGKALVNLGNKLLVGKPDEVFETHGHHLVVVSELEVELGAGRRVGKAVRNIGEQSGFPEALGRLLEVILGGIRTDLESAGCRDLFRAVALASGHSNRDQLMVIGRIFGRWLPRSLRACDQGDKADSKSGKASEIRHAQGF